MTNKKHATSAARRYLRDVRYNLPCSFKTKRELLARLQEALGDYTGERPHATYDDIVEHFGAPTDVADTYFADLPAPQLRRSLQIARNVRRALIAVIVLTMLLYTFLIGLIFYNISVNGLGYITVDQGEILVEYK